MEYMGIRRSHALLQVWTGAVLLFVLLPVLCVAVAAWKDNSPDNAGAFCWWESTASVPAAPSLLFALTVTLGSTLLALCSALALARYSWQGRKLLQKIVLLPLFLPQLVPGLALQLWCSTHDIPLSWLTTAWVQLIWIVPLVTLVIAMRLYGYDPALEAAARDLGASRLQIFSQITLPLLWPGIWSGLLLAFLLSWSSFPLPRFPSGMQADVSSLTVPASALASDMAVTAAVMLAGAFLLWCLRIR